jgi:peptidoglycan/LPS O-acetylase OafA/YrhL
LNPISTTGSRIKFIDGLRAIAVLLVVFFHFYFQQISEQGKYDVSPLFLQDIFRYGNMGVYIFFVISGFIISFVTFGKVTNWSYIWKFILRRQIRLDPPFWLTVVMGVVIAVVSVKVLNNNVHVPDALDVVTNVTYTFDILNRYDIIRVGWTLCLEIQFYLVYILISFLLQKWNVSIKIEAGFLYLLFLGSLLTLIVFGSRSSAFIVNYWYVFFMGVAVTMTVKKRLDTKMYFLFLVTPLSLLFLFPSLGVAQVLFGSITSLSIFLAFRLKKLDQWLSWRIIQFFGTISYSLYLTHCLIGNKVIRYLKNRMNWTPDNFLSTLLVLFTAFAISCIFAWIFYSIVERRSVQWSKKLTT